MQHREKTPPAAPLSLLRTFCLERREDESGVSGTGVVAIGVVLPSGKAVIEWTTVLSSIAMYDSVELLEQIHSHGGRTVVRFLDEAPASLVAAAWRAVQDRPLTKRTAKRGKSSSAKRRRRN